jgi:hypothetical protein
MKDSILHLHSVCEGWKKELKLLRIDIHALRSRLEDIVVKHPNQDILAQVEHFENKFSILETHVRNLMHDVKTRDRSLMSKAEAQPKSAAARMVDTDQETEEQILMTSRDFYETKNEYKKFLALVF